MSQSDISQALETAIRAIPGMVPIQEVGNPTNTPPNAPHALWDVIFNPPSVASLGEDGMDRHDGFAQLTLRWPLGPNAKDQLLALADTIRESFKAGTRAVHGDQYVVIINSGIGPFDVIQGRLVNPFTIYWYSHTRR